MTSNIGVRQLKDFGSTGVGFALQLQNVSRKNADENNKAVIEKALEENLSARNF